MKYADHAKFCHAEKVITRVHLRHLCGDGKCAATCAACHSVLVRCARMESCQRTCQQLERHVERCFCGVARRVTGKTGDRRLVFGAMSAP